MIIKATRISTSSGAGAVAAHVLRGEKNEEIRLLQGSEQEMHAAARDAEAAGAKYALRHYKIAPQSEMTSEDARDILRDLGREFGFDPERATLIEHQKPRAGGAGFDRHWHAIVPEVDAITGRVLDAHWMRPRHEKIARIAEARLGHEVTPGRFNAAVQRALEAEGRHDVAARIQPATEVPRPKEGYATNVHQMAARHGHDLPNDRLAIRQAWEQSDGGQAFRAALAERGIRIEEGEKEGVYVAYRDQDFLGAVHRLVGVPKLEAAARLQDAPALEQPATPAEPAPQPPQPPGGGEHVPAPVEAATATTAPQDAPAPGAPAAQGEAQPSAATATPTPAPAPKGGGGGGGGGDGGASAAEAPKPGASDLFSSEDPTAGIEPPKPGDLAGELRYREAVMKKAAEIAERKARQKTPAPQQQGGSHGRVQQGGGVGGGGGSDELAKAAGRAIEGFFEALRRGAEHAAARRDLAAALAALDGNHEARRGDAGQGRAGETPASRESSAGDRHPRRDEHAPRERGAEPDSGNSGQSSDARRGNDEARKEAGRALAARALTRKLDLGLTITDPTRRRDAFAELAASNDPTAGMTAREKGAAIKDWTAELLAEFRDERKGAGAERWRARMLEQRMRAEPAVAVLRSRRRLKPHERAAAWDEIKAAEKRAKGELKAAAPPDFRAFLECLAEVDPKARAVLTHEQAKDERNVRIRAALDAEASAIAAIRGTAPQGERDPAKAARDAKERLKAENENNQQQAKEARKAADDAAARVAWWHGKNHPTRIAARDAERNAENLEWTARVNAPSPTDFREEAEKAEQRAGRTARAFTEWQRGPGQEADRRDALLSGVKSALKAKDGDMWRAMDRGGYAEAARLQAQREAEEQRKREAADRKVIPLATARREHTQEATHALPAPRMR